MKQILNAQLASDFDLNNQKIVDSTTDKFPELDDGLISTGTFGSGNNLTVAGSGTRAFWYPRKNVFIATRVTGTQIDDSNIGIYSGIIGGINNQVPGTRAFIGGCDSVICSADRASGAIGSSSGTVSINRSALGGTRASDIIDTALDNECNFIGGALDGIITDCDYSGMLGVNDCDMDDSRQCAIIASNQSTMDTAEYSIIAGTLLSTLNSDNSGILGGISNTISTGADSSFILGGATNTVSATSNENSILNSVSSDITGTSSGSVIIGALDGTITNAVRSIVCGKNGTVSGDDGVHLFADQTATAIASTADNQFIVQADGGMGVGGAPDSSAKLDIQSTTTGFLRPRMTTAQRGAISTPATGLEVFDTDLDMIMIYNGSQWVPNNILCVNGGMKDAKKNSTELVLWGEDADQGYDMPKDGLIVALNITSNDSITTDDYELQITINGVAETGAGKTLKLTTVDPDSNSVYLAEANYISFSAGDVVSMQIVGNSAEPDNIDPSYSFFYALSI